MIIVPAEEADLPRLIKFRTDASMWLRTLGTDQWAKPFPADRLLGSIRRGEVFMIREQPYADAAATITLDREADTRLWTPEEIAEPALYVHKLAVDRAYAGTGLGSALLDWAGEQAVQQGGQVAPAGRLEHKPTAPGLLPRTRLHPHPNRRRSGSGLGLGGAATCRVPVLARYDTPVDVSFGAIAERKRA
ncbi:hypothetical protein GCM10020295_83100 [Streptomyces cinereospinus]